MYPCQKRREREERHGVDIHGQSAGTVISLIEGCPVNTRPSLLAALSALIGLRKNWPFSPLSRVPARRPLADLKGMVPTQSQTQKFGIQGSFPRNGKPRRLVTGHLGVGWLGPQCLFTHRWTPLEQQQQELLTSTRRSPVSGPSALTTLHHECFAQDKTEAQRGSATCPRSHSG